MTTVPAKHVFESVSALQPSCQQDVVATEYIQVTQDQVNQFADLSLDRQWIHLDVERSERDSPFKGTIVHGFLTLSLGAYFLQSGIRIREVRFGVITALKYARFISVVPVGSWIRGRIKLLDVEEVRGNTQGTWMVTIERRGAPIPCCVMEIVVVYYT